MTANTKWESDIREIVRKYALQNALEYKGNGKSSSVLGRIMSERKDLRVRAKELREFVEEEVYIANKLSSEKGIAHLRNILADKNPDALVRKKQERRTGLPELPNSAEMKVVLRFAPNPNGPLTLGHSRGVVINSQFAEKYEGKVILRFDDTDTKIKPPLVDAYRWIEEEYEWITGRSADLVIRASERMPLYLEYAEKMIEKGYGYVCKCSASEFKKLRDKGRGSPYRDRSVDENLIDWRKMINGSMKEGEAVVRVRTSLDLPNPALRDWPALRIQHKEHPIVGEKYKVWPLLDFQSAIEDHEQGVTHIIRGKDLMDSTRKQKLLYEHFDWKYPETLYWGRVKVFEFGGFSTSGMRESISKGKYSDWDDIRLPTIKSLRRRGFNPTSLTEFWLDLGLTQKDISVSMKTIESFNIKKIDATTPRRSFVRSPVEVEIDYGVNKSDIQGVLKLANHPEGTVRGDRKWKIGEEKELAYVEQEDIMGKTEFRLKDFADISLKGNIGYIDSIERSDKRPIIHWITGDIAREALLYVPDGDKISTYRGLLENYDLKEGHIYQLERIGFVKVENYPKEGIIEMVWLHG